MNRNDVHSAVFVLIEAINKIDLDSIIKLRHEFRKRLNEIYTQPLRN